MSTHAMIDIETLGTMPNSVILSVGAVKFDPFKSHKPHDGRPVSYTHLTLPTNGCV